MDTCSKDITVEFLAVAFNSILYYSSVYPECVFEKRRKYNIVVYSCIHPEVSQYINLCLKSVKECLKNGQLSRVVFAVTNNNYEPLVNFVFNIYENAYYEETHDAYLIQVEQNLRSFFLHLSSITDKLKSLPEDSSFSVFIHTNESTAVTIATTPDLEDFPLVEITESTKESESIIPLRNFPLRGYCIESYVEL